MLSVNLEGLVRASLDDTSPAPRDVTPDRPQWSVYMSTASHSRANFPYSYFVNEVNDPLPFAVIHLTVPPTSI